VSVIKAAGRTSKTYQDLDYEYKTNPRLISLLC